VKAEIKSSFIPKSSTRSTKLKVDNDDISTVVAPKEGTLADRHLQAALAKDKARKKGN
jgi:hypothetical protein